MIQIVCDGNYRLPGQIRDQLLIIFFSSCPSLLTLLSPVFHCEQSQRGASDY